MTEGKDREEEMGDLKAGEMPGESREVERGN